VRIRVALGWGSLLLGYYVIAYVTWWAAVFRGLNLILYFVVLFGGPVVFALVKYFRSANEDRLAGVCAVGATATVAVLAGLFFGAGLHHGYDSLKGIVFSQDASSSQGIEQQPEQQEQVIREAFDAMRRQNPEFKALVWPPPSPSAMASIHRRLFTPNSTLADVAEQLTSALKRAGYDNLSYYYVPQGFAIVTGIEQIRDDGSPLDSDRRWFAEPAVEFSLAEYIRLLLRAPVGRYRSIVFTITPEVYLPSLIVISRNELAAAFCQGGSPRLPSLYGKVSFSLPYMVDALIYEFAGRAGSDPVLVKPSAISGNNHILRAHIWASLEPNGAPQ
jgi:hypothetical protein